MSQEVKTLVRYRMERAGEAMEEARLLMGIGHANAAVSRLYYAAFYAVSAALLSRGLSSSKHSGVRALFHQKLVKPGVVPTKTGRFFDTLFDSRQKSDYGDLVRFDEASVTVWAGQTEELLEVIRELVSEGKGLPEES